MAGSVSINVDLPDTEAYVQDAKLTLGGDSWVKANEAAEIAAIAGSGAYRRQSRASASRSPST